MPAQHATDRIPVIEVIVAEPVDAATAARLHARIEEALLLNPDLLVVDLAACPHLDAAGIGMLLQAHHQAHQAGARLALRCPAPQLRRVLALARVDHVLQVTPPADGPGQ